MNKSIRGKKASFSKYNRIFLKKDFDFILQNGKRRKSALFTLIIDKAELNYSRLGIRISKKIGNAVMRNKIKRKLKEIFRLHKHLFSESIDIIIIPSITINTKSYSEINQEFLYCMNKFFKQ